MDDLGDQGAVSALIEGRSDDELGRLMTNLGGHDLTAVLEAFHAIDHDRPVCFIAYTVKRHGLPLAGHKDNHAGLMTPEQLEGFRAGLGIRESREWEPFEAMSLPQKDIEDFLRKVPFNAEGRRRFAPPRVHGHPALPSPSGDALSNQE